MAPARFSAYNVGSPLAVSNATLAVVTTNPDPGVISSFLARLATPRLFLVAAALLGLDLLIPDFIPFVDEALLLMVTLIFSRRKRRVGVLKTDGD